MKFFWALSDGTTVRELSREQYMKMHPRRGRKTGWVDEDCLLLAHGTDIVIISFRQLSQILKMKP